MPVGSSNVTPEAAKDRELWVIVRRGLLTIIDGIERRHGLTRTSEAIEFYRYHHRPARKGNGE